MEPIRPPLHLAFASLLCTLILLQFAAPISGWAQSANTSSTDQGTSTSSSGQVVNLSPFEVSSTAVTQGYGVMASNSEGRIALPLIDIPQTVSIINSNLINDFNIQDTRQLYDNMPNVYQGSKDQANRVWVRGSEVNTIYVDGVQSFSRPAMPMQFYDRVELVSGPVSSAFGVGQPGGIINYITKAPTGNTDTNIEVGYGQWQNMELNIDTEGHMPMPKSESVLGHVTYRMDAFLNKGNYQIQTEKHSGLGMELALRDQFNRTTQALANLQFVSSLFPDSNDPFILYSNQVAYTWLQTVLGAAHGGSTKYPTLPNSNPYPAGGSVLGDWAGGTLLPQGTNAMPNNYGGRRVHDFRASLAVEKDLFDNTLSIRNTATYEYYNEDSQYITWSGGWYIDPKTGVPYNEEGPALPYPNSVYGPVSQIGITLNPLESFLINNTRSDNLDVDYRKTFHGISIDLSFGGDANESGIRVPYRYIYHITKPDGSTFYEMINRPTDINIYQNPATQTQNNVAEVYAWGGYANLSASFFKNRITLAYGDRRDAGGTKSMNFLNNVVGSSGTLYSKGAPRYSIMVKPLPWLSVYALKARHDDPPKLAQRYYINLPGPDVNALYAKYNNFNNLFTYSPAGDLQQVGAKAMLLHGNLIVSADYFHFKTFAGIATNVIKDTDPSSPTYGSVVVENYLTSNSAKGCEIQVMGQVTKHLTITGYYGITRGAYPDYADGEPHVIGPPTTTALHFRYDFGSIPGFRELSALRGFDFYVLGGVNRWGPYWNSQNPWVYYQTAQYIFDGGCGVIWDRGRQSLNFIMDNIGGKIPFISPQTAYADGGSTQQWWFKYRFRL